MSYEAYASLIDDLTGKNLRADAAFYALTHVEPERTGEVLERAAEIAQAENASKPPRKQKSATTHAEPAATQPARQESRQSASESKAESVKTGPKPIPVAKSLYEALAASYSADRIQAGKIAKPVKTDGHGLLVCVSSSGRQCECYRLLTPDQYGEPPLTYHGRDKGAAREDPNGFYHGIVVRTGAVPYVLFGPPLVFEPFASAPPAPAAPVVQKRHVERAAKEAKAVKKDAPKARGRAAVSPASGVTRTLPELRKLFDVMRGASYPDPMRSFVSEVDRWWLGDATDKEVLSHWSQLAMLVEDGLKHSRRAMPAVKRAKKGRK
jgi:putative hemolysin